MRNQKLQKMLWKVHFWIESVLATVLHLLVLPHLENIVPVLLGALRFLQRCSVQILHSNFSVYILDGVSVFVNMLTLWHHLILFKTDWTAMPIATVKFMYCVVCKIPNIHFQLLPAFFNHEHEKLLGPRQVRYVFLHGLLFLGTTPLVKKHSPAPILWPLREWLMVMCLVHITSLSQAIC